MSDAVETGKKEAVFRMSIAIKRYSEQADFIVDNLAEKLDVLEKDELRKSVLEALGQAYYDGTQDVVNTMEAALVTVDTNRGKPF